MIDFYPTLAELCGLPAPRNLSGVSLVATLKDPNIKTRESAFTQYDVGYSVRTERYRYNAWGEDGALGAELYDRAADPEELVNLAGKANMAATEMRLKKLWQQRVQAARKVPPRLKQVPRSKRK
jgi:arylsulfatase A-like enzyme